MNTQLAYSLFEIKALDDDKRMITGIATTPEPDRVGDIVEPMGATFKESIPFLWQHRHDQPIGETRLSRPTKNGIKFVSTIAKIEEEGPLKTMLDMAWQSIKAGLVRGVSIGFRPTKYDYMSEGGVRFTEYEIYELSAVTIPANAAATIQSIKALDFRRRADGPVRLITSAKSKSENLNGAVRLIRS
jgi:HK97 family phage prohead protease